MADKSALLAIIHGHVQGVYFRAFIAEKAKRLGIQGYVKNLSSGTDVEAYAEGDKDILAQLLAQMKIGPPGANVESVTTHWSLPKGKYKSFSIQY